MTDDPAPTETPEVAVKPTRFPGSLMAPLHGVRVPLADLLVAVLVVAAAAATITVYLLLYRPDAQTGDDAARSAVAAASEGTVAILSLSPETLDDAVAAAKSRLTGDFLSQYSELIDRAVAPATKDQSTTTTATVVQAGVAALHPRSAQVLVFVNQQTSSPDLPEPRAAASSVLVGVTKVNDAWLISSFDPA